MAPTAVKRENPEDVDARTHKSQRITTTKRIAEHQAIRPNKLWETICKTDAQSLCEIVYHATLANIDPQLSLRVLNIHQTRLHNLAAAAEQARKAQELRDKRDRKKIADFDHYYR